MGMILILVLQIENLVYQESWWEISLINTFIWNLSFFHLKPELSTRMWYSLSLSKGIFRWKNSPVWSQFITKRGGISFSAMIDRTVDRNTLFFNSKSSGTFLAALVTAMIPVTKTWNHEWTSYTIVHQSNRICLCWSPYKIEFSMAKIKNIIWHSLST